MTTLSRGAFLFAGASIGGGLAVGLSNSTPGEAADAQPPVKPNAFVRIERDGTIALMMPYVEMGQGAYTSTSMLIAEELEVELSQVRALHAPADAKLYANPLFGDQITGGSASLRGAWEPMRRVGAAARMMLVAAAAKQWNVAPAECTAVRGIVIHAASGRRLAYGDLADAASKLPVPRDIVLKDPATFRLIGTSPKRLDTPSKVNGSAIYGIDVHPAGVKVAAILPCPIINGKLLSVNDGAARKVRGVLHIVKVDDAVAVVATHTGAARKGLAALDVRWDAGRNAQLSTRELLRECDDSLERPGLIATRIGDSAAAEASAASVFEATYRLPLLAHLAMEPLNCTVNIKGNSCEIWTSTQVADRARKIAAAAAGVPYANVVVYNHYLGGGFGRRLDADFVGEAVKIANHVSGPVKVLWAREEDVRHDSYRYHNHSRVTVALDAAGMPTSWRHKIVGPGVMLRFLPSYTKDGVDLDIVDSAAGPYTFANELIEFVRQEAPDGMLTGNWRGVGPTRNGMIVEGVMDELAYKAGRDPLDYRRTLLGNSPRALNVLNLAAQQAGWGRAMPPRHGLGLAVISALGSHFAQVAEVSVAPNGAVRVLRVVCAMDCGYAVNPDIVKAQIEGGIMFGLSAVLFEKITVERGSVRESNYDTFRVLRMNEAPAVDVILVKSTEEPGGVGEPGTAAVEPAIINAVFAATKKRIRTLPIDPEILRII